MASRRLLKKQINVAVASVIDHCYDITIDAPEKQEKVEPIIDEAVELFDNLIVLVNNYRNADNKAAYFAEIEGVLEKEIDALTAKIKKA